MSIEDDLKDRNPLAGFTAEELASEICDRFGAVVLLCDPTEANHDKANALIADGVIGEEDLSEEESYFTMVKGNMLTCLGMIHDYSRQPETYEMIHPRKSR